MSAQAGSSRTPLQLASEVIYDLGVDHVACKSIMYIGECGIETWCADTESAVVAGSDTKGTQMLTTENWDKENQ